MRTIQKKTILDKIAGISSPYTTESKKQADKKLLDSVFDIAMCYMNTLRHTTLVDANYGIKSSSFLFQAMNDISVSSSYYKSIETGLMANDSRIKAVSLSDKSYKHKQHGKVSYLDIIIYIKNELFSNEDIDLSLRLAYDFTGTVFRVKQ